MANNISLYKQYMQKWNVVTFWTDLDFFLKWFNEGRPSHGLCFHDLIVQECLYLVDGCQDINTRVSVTGQSKFYWAPLL